MLILQQVRLDRFEEWLITRQAWELVGKAGVTRNDIEDIKQDIRLDILKRLPRFDPAKSSRHNFVAMVVRRCVASILKQRGAVRRNGGQRPKSLNVPILDAEGREVELAQTLAADTEEDGTRDLRADVRAVIASLPDGLRMWCGILSEQSIREAIRTSHLSRHQIRRIRAEICVAFAKAGLADYLPKKNR